MTKSKTKTPALATPGPGLSHEPVWGTNQNGNTQSTDQNQEQIFRVDIRKSHTEVLRIEVSEFAGRSVFSIRTWFLSDEGSLRPGKSGITLALKRLPSVAEALQKALDHSRSKNLLTEGAHDE
jgi:Transcriptional Coactivator p15 (PC4)